MFHDFTTLHHRQKTRARSEDLAFLCYAYSIHSGRRWSSSRRRYASAPISRISLTPAATHAIARLRKSIVLLLNLVAYPSEMECSIAKSGQWTKVASTEIG